MNLQQLYYFQTIAELEHFTKAADKLMVTQPSLSHSINDLESELGVHLFERQGRNVKLTKYGSIFLEYVTESLAVLDEGRNKLNDFIDPTKGTVSLAYYSSMEDFMPFLVSKYFAETEHIQVKFKFFQLPNNSIENSLLDGTADLAFATGMNNDKLAAHKIGVHNVVLIVSGDHPLSKRDSVDISELGGERFITYNYQCQLRYHIDTIFSLAGISPEIISETTHDTIIYSSVAANFGVALVPQPIGTRHYNVKVLRIENEVPDRNIFITWKNVRYISPAVKRFRDFVIKNDLILDQYRRSISTEQY